MYLFIDTVTNEIDLQPVETIHICRFSDLFEELKTLLYDEIENMNQILSDHKPDQTCIHTLRIFKVVNGSDFIFNPMTSQYLFDSLPLVEETYESCDV
jgi:hypothetical protein